MSSGNGSFGLRLRTLREGMDLSLRDLADRSGVSAPMLSQVERGETSPTLQVAGRIALVDRGSCTFTVKTANAQAAGAVGVLVASDDVSSLPPMGGSDPTSSITIPSYGISQGLGAAMRNAIGGGVNVTLGYSMLQVAGGSFSNVRLHAPSAFQPVTS